MEDVASLLLEKATLHGAHGGFFENNFPNEGSKGFSHALGEARIKIAEFRNSGKRRDLVKAITWLYLVYETGDRNVV